MFDFNVKKGSAAIERCRQEKMRLRDIWVKSEAYYSNQATTTMWQDYTKLIGEHYIGWDNDNQIPDAVRVWLSTVYNSSLEIGGEAPYNDPLANLAAEAVVDYLRAWRKEPQFNRDLLDISLRMLLYNAVAQIDFYDRYANAPHGNLGARIIPHNDFYCEEGSYGPINDPDGPRWVAYRLFLTKDEVINRYGAEKVNELKHGPLSISDANSSQVRADVFDDRYEIIEFWGKDNTLEDVTRSETEMSVGEQFRDALKGEPKEVEAWEDHAASIEVLNEFLIVLATGEEEDEVELSVAVARLEAPGTSQYLEAYTAVRTQHEQFIQAGNPGGRKEKYFGGIYRAEFQEGDAEPLRGPEASPYQHGQIPVSFYQRHRGISTYWTRGVMAEALPIQQEIEFWMNRRKRFGHIKAEPPLALWKDAFEKQNIPTSNILAALERGRAVFEMRTPVGTGPLPLPTFVDVGRWDWNVDQIIQDLRQRMFRLFGATEEMRGEAPGAEASGRHIELKMEAGSRHVTFTLALIESPLQRHFQRLSNLVINSVPLERIASVCGPEKMAALQAVRESGQPFEMRITLDLGRGMPQDFANKYQIYFNLLSMQIITPQEFAERTGIPFTPAPPPPPEAAGEQANNQGGP